MNNQAPRFVILFAALAAAIGLAGCQSAPTKTTQAQTEDAHRAAINGPTLSTDAAMEWEVLRQMAVTTLKTGDIQNTQNILENMLSAAENHPSRWQQLAQVVAGLPREQAKNWLQKLAATAMTHHNADIFLSLSQLAMALEENQQAMELVNQAMALDQNNPKARFWRARLLELEKNTLQAQVEYQWLADHYPDEPKYREALATLLGSQGQWDTAEAIYKTLPQNRDTVFKRLLLALQQQQKERAQTLFEQLQAMPVDSENKPEEADRLWFLQGEAARLLERSNDALHAYRQVKGGTQYISARFRLAAELEKQEQHEQALEVLQQLQNADTETATQAAIYRATILDRLKRGQDAIAVLSESLRYQPQNTDLLYARGLLYERHDNLEAMERDLQAILAMDPDNAAALNALGYTLADHNIRLKEARKYLQKALRLEPDNPAIIDSMGWLHYRLGNYSEAEKLIRKALSLSGRDPEIYHHLIAVLKAQGKANEASAIARQARTEFPDFDR